MVSLTLWLASLILVIEGGNRVTEYTLPLQFACLWLAAGLDQTRHETRRLFAIGLLCAMYIYIVFVARHLDEPGARPRGGFSSLDGVISLFKSPRVVLGGWIHFLAFDLMVGLYIVTDAVRLGITHWWLMPALFLTLMFGPAGLLLYLVMRVVMVPGVVATIG